MFFFLVENTFLNQKHDMANGSETHINGITEGNQAAIGDNSTHYEC